MIITIKQILDGFLRVYNTYFDAPSNYFLSYYEFKECMVTFSQGSSHFNIPN